jgi:CYTH domain-containing protein
MITESTPSSIFDPSQPIDKVVVDGGPCGGKTSSMAFAESRLAEHGVIALVVPEVATILKSGNVHPKDFSDVDYQLAVIKMQRHNEQIFSEMAMELQRKYQKRVVLLCDRGLLSGAAYMQSDEQYMLADFQKKVLDALGFSVEEIRSSYAGAIHLVTAADGAPEYYTNANNPLARDEKIGDALILDKRSQMVHAGMEEFESIPNIVGGHSISFETKKQLFTGALFRILGVPYFIQNERRFVLNDFDPLALSKQGIHAEVVTIEQYYLTGLPRVEISIRKRTWMNRSVYYLRTKHPHIGAQRIRTSYAITEKKYYEYLHAEGASVKKVIKNRYCFTYQHTYYKVDVFSFPKGTVTVLEMYGDGTPPSFLCVQSEVTGNEHYRNAVYAR